MAQRYYCSLQKLLKGWSPEKMLPLTLGIDEEKPEGKTFHFIVKM